MVSGQVVVFLLSISLMLLAAKVFGELFTRLKQPPIVGEILAGVVLGPTVFGTLSPGLFNFLFPANSGVGTALDGIITLAVVMLLLVSGIEVDLAIVLKQGKKAILTGLMGIMIPFSVGFSFSYMFPQAMGIQEQNMVFVFALFMGTALSISALPVIAKTLMDLKIFNTEIGYVIISAAMFNDLIGWLVFSVILGMIGGKEHGIGFGGTIILTLLFAVFVLIFVRKIFDKILPWVQKKTSFPGGVLNMVFISAFLGAAFTEYIGIHAIFGAFMIGIAVGDSAHLSEKTREVIHQFVTNIFAPLFFVSIGLRVNFISSFDLPLVIIILLLSIVGKVIGCGLGAYWAGMNKVDSLIVGFGMNSRGTMEVILGLLALQFGLIQESVFVALVVMALFTSIISAPLMNYLLKRREKISFNDLIVPEHIYFTNASDRDDIIKTLAGYAGKSLRLNEDEIYNAVKEREELIPTGIANYLAIPHAKLKINRPFAAVAINNKGIDFGADDKLNSKIIILLLSPLSDNAIQLKLLSEIASKFTSREKAEELFEIKNTEQFMNKLRSA